MKKIKAFAYCLFVLALPAKSQKSAHFNLHEYAVQHKFQLVHRRAQPLEDGSLKGARLSQDTGEGLAWIPAADFSLGTIEFDTRGKDEFQRSFVGIAFHGQNDSTYEAIYFRPFNFLAKDSVRHIHAVQYISHPVFTWRKLREDKATNAQFEKAVSNPPDPNGWFHARVVVAADSVSVFINSRTVPELSVKRLTGLKRGKIGLFAGDGSGGYFANLAIYADAR